MLATWGAPYLPAFGRWGLSITQLQITHRATSYPRASIHQFPDYVFGWCAYLPRSWQMLVFQLPNYQITQLPICFRP
jgi:hypothetical protein